MKNTLHCFQQICYPSNAYSRQTASSKVPGGCCQRTGKPVQMFKMVESDGAFACLNTSSSRHCSCQNTPGGHSAVKNTGALAR